ncbi:relaxase/mobilization nuclease domain-containing protein [Tenacibaculum soleae]|uniref:relaxase/mobilization nuclease domain-containing protein n=1 Tax=Tenacibaculum soleae TaxID=447689 RepID=UPI0026E451F0|nr:relaxase/mobilization nuclease domain-containing protein [Tenacibaculum soleae]MDO6812256.1 relaxase/mobilization nuclease domain-containing protein [Tenacibaculum soleae]
MIGKGKSISHTKASIEYGWNQEKDAEIVFTQNLAGETPKEITDEFETIQSMNDNCERNTFSFVISPTIEDGEKLTSKDLNKITDEFLKDLKLENHQAIAFVHNDKNHKHIHLYVNRIDFEGKAYNDSFIGKRSQKSAERVAEKMQLQTVKQVKEQKLEKVKDIRKFIKNKHELSFKSFHPKKYQNYIKEMGKFNIKVNPVINKKSDKLQGFRYQFKNVNLKGSDVHRSMSINKLNINYYKIAKTIIKQVSKGISI